MVRRTWKEVTARGISFAVGEVRCWRNALTFSVRFGNPILHQGMVSDPLVRWSRTG